MPNKEWTQHIILRALTVQKKKDITEKLISNLSPDHFSLDTYKIAFKRLYALYLKKGRLLSWKELIFDPSIPEKNRDKLRVREIKRGKLILKDKSLLLPKSYDEFSALLESNWYNSVHNKTVLLQNKLTEELSNKQLTNNDITRVYEEIEKSLVDIKQLSSTSGTIFHLSKPTITECLSNFRNKLKNNFFIPTGFKEFDDRNLGIPVDSFFLIAGKTGSGKSTISLSLAMNFKRSGARVCFIPLEMGVEQLLVKMAASILKVSVTNIVKDFDFYEKKVVKAVSKFLVKDEDSPECFDFYVPEPEATLEDVLTKLKPNQYDMIIVDYISLLAPMDKEDWKSLDKAGRLSKVFATNNKTIVCLLAQLDETTENVRYSRGLTEHSSNCWIWPEDHFKIKETGYVTIKQKKARNQDPFSFRLAVDLSTSSVSDYINDGEEKITIKAAEGFDDIIPTERSV